MATKKFLKGFHKTADGLGDMINANISKRMGAAAPKLPTPAPAPATSAMGQVFSGIRNAFGNS